MKNVLIFSAVLFLFGCAASKSRVDRALDDISSETNEFISEHKKAPKNKEELLAYAKERSKKLDFKPFTEISFSADTTYLPSFTYEISYRARGSLDEHSIMGSTIACSFK
jgi:hypothetical protein